MPGYSYCDGNPVGSSWTRRLLMLPVAAVMLVSSILPSQADDKIHPIEGPSQVQLGDKLATLSLPAGYGFINKSDAEKILKESGSSVEGALGIIVPADISEKAKSKEEPWYIVCRFDDCGYVKDDDAGKLNANEILQSYKDGSSEQNEERKELGLEPIYVGGWAESPRYEKSRHHVVWAIQVKEEDSTSAPVAAVNYNTRILGRRGVLSMNLVTSPDTLNHDKEYVAKILNATSFQKGQSYSDYQPGKDKSAGFGLTGLILGGGAVAAAAKLGVFGGLWKFILGIVLVAKKFIILAVVGVVGLIGKIFGGKKEQ